MGVFTFFKLCNGTKSRDASQSFSWNFDLPLINCLKFDFSLYPKNVCSLIHSPNDEINAKRYLFLPVSDVDVQKSCFLNAIWKL